MSGYYILLQNVLWNDKARGIFLTRKHKDSAGMKQESRFHINVHRAWKSALTGDDTALQTALRIAVSQESFIETHNLMTFRRGRLPVFSVERNLTDCNETIVDRVAFVWATEIVKDLLNVLLIGRHKMLNLTTLFTGNNEPLRCHKPRQCLF
jgi:hypothetical protein